MSVRNTSNVKVALDSKAARFNVKKRELDENLTKSHQFERTVGLNSLFLTLSYASKRD